MRKPIGALLMIAVLCLQSGPTEAKHQAVRHYLNGLHGLTRATWYDYGSVTASGRGVFFGEVAADPSIPFGSTMVLPGEGTFVVLDRGGSVYGAHVDVYLPYPGYRYVPDWVRGAYWE